MTAPLATHASAVLLGEGAVLIRGPSGSGKSALAMALVELASRSRFARLVGDDRVTLQGAGGRLLVRPVAAIAGLVERRGLGLTPVSHEAAAVVAMVVDLAEGQPARLPEPEDMVVEIAGVTLPRLLLPRAGADPLLVLAALDLFTTSAVEG